MNAAGQYRAASSMQEEATIDGATPNDLCLSGGGCKNLNCTHYHPQWANGVCIHFLHQKCMRKKCPVQHVAWRELKNTADPNDFYDCFTNQPFRPKIVEANPLLVEQANVLGYKQYFGGLSVSPVDEEHFRRLVKHEVELLESKDPRVSSLQGWYKDMKELVAIQKEECKYCRDQYTFREIDRVLLTFGKQDPYTCANCIGLENTMRIANKYLQTHPFLHGDFPTKADLEDFHYYQKVEKILESSEHAELIEWYHKIKQQADVQKGTCVSCSNVVVSYSEFMQSVMGLKKDAPYCPQCYQGIKVLVNHSFQLGSAKCYFGFARGELQRELGIYRKLQDFKGFVQDLDNPHFEAWFAKIREHGEVKVVQCDICQKELKGDLRSRLTIGTLKGYCCSQICRLQLVSRFKKAERTQNRIQMLEDLRQRTGLPRQNSEQINSSSVELEEEAAEQDDLLDNLKFFEQVIIKSLNPEEVDQYKQNMMKLYVQEGNDNINQLLSLLKKHNNDAFDALIELKEGQMYEYLPKRCANRWRRQPSI